MVTAAALPADTARLTPDAGLHGVVHERRDEVARLRGDADRRRPAGTAPRSARTATPGVDTTPWPFGPGDEHPELVGQRHQLGLEALTLLPRLAVAGRREERGADALLGAGAEQVGVGRRRACTRRRGRSRRRAGRRCRRPPARRGRRPARGSSRGPRPGSRRRGCCGGSRSRTCRGGSTRRRRARPAARTAPGSRAGSTAIRPPRPARRRGPAGRRRRSAG